MEQDVDVDLSKCEICGAPRDPAQPLYEGVHPWCNGCIHASNDYGPGQTLSDR